MSVCYLPKSFQQPFKGVCVCVCVCVSVEISLHMNGQLILNNCDCLSIFLPPHSIFFSPSLSLPLPLSLHLCLSLLVSLFSIPVSFSICFPYPLPDSCLHGQKETESGDQPRTIGILSISHRCPSGCLLPLPWVFPPGWEAGKGWFPLALPPFSPRAP